MSMQENKIVILSGAGLSAESGLPTFRDSGGLWKEYSWEDVATPEGWAVRPETVLAFYNERRLKASEAQPNAAHKAIAALQDKYEVVVITQNVDELHELAGSRQVIHLHGELAWARGTSPARRRHRMGAAPIALGQLCEDGTQLRPDIVWFGEETQHMDEARGHVASAARVLVVGTSLSVYPAASLVTAASKNAHKVLNCLDIDQLPHGFRYIQGKATSVVPALVEDWLACS